MRCEGTWGWLNTRLIASIPSAAHYKREGMEAALAQHKLPPHFEQHQHAMQLQKTCPLMEDKQLSQWEMLKQKARAVMPRLEEQQQQAVHLPEFEVMHQESIQQPDHSVEGLLSHLHSKLLKLLIPSQEQQQAMQLPLGTLLVESRRQEPHQSNGLLDLVQKWHNHVVSWVSCQQQQQPTTQASAAAGPIGDGI
jgi:hypothetical protein